MSATQTTLWAVSDAGAFACTGATIVAEPTPALADGLPPAPYRHESDTSRLAAESQTHSKRMGDMRRIYDLLDPTHDLGRGCVGLTCDEIEQALSMSHQTASARISEMYHNSQMPYRLRLSGEKRKTRTGSQANVYVRI